MRFVKQLVLIAALALIPVSALAETPQAAACRGARGNLSSDGDCVGADGINAFEGGLKSIANILIFAVGAVAVLMVIIGGLRYALSGGDASGIKSAKDTILYAIVGVVVAALSYAVVNFVIFKLDETPPTTGAPRATTRV
jgi:hypothetical protein